MLDTSRVGPHLAAARAQAGRHRVRHQLEEQLTFLDRFAAPLITRCILFADRPPWSLTIHIEALGADGVWRHWMLGALIYHGSPDQSGSGHALRRADYLSPFPGWHIHL